jgi:hypothetical protein
MHEIILMEVFNSLADISEISFDKLFVELAVAEFDLFVETAS